jgi:hypothetical protein
MAEVKPLSRSEREAQIKDKAGWVITVLAAMLLTCMVVLTTAVT